MRFRNDSDETTCSAPIDNYGRGLVDAGPFACMRRAGHDGHHIIVMRDAARADGVCHGCRMPLDGPHREGCDVIP